MFEIEQKTLLLLMLPSLINGKSARFENQQTLYMAVVLVFAAKIVLCNRLISEDTFTVIINSILCMMGANMYYLFCYKYGKSVKRRFSVCIWHWLRASS